MREDVEKEKTRGLQLGARATQHFLPIAQVLEHFDADNAVEAFLESELLCLHGAHLDVVQTALGCSCENEFSLAC